MRFLTGVGAFVVATMLEALIIVVVAAFTPEDVTRWEGVAVGAISVLVGINLGVAAAAANE